jgi:hypothetical protein
MISLDVHLSPRDPNPDNNGRKRAKFETIFMFSRAHSFLGIRRYAATRFEQLPANPIKAQIPPLV